MFQAIKSLLGLDDLDNAVTPLSSSDPVIPVVVMDRFKQHYKGDLDPNVIADAFLEYCDIVRENKGIFIAMPSKEVDELWHVFLLFTREYDAFCDEVIGFKLHHEPESTAGESKMRQGEDALAHLYVKKVHDLHGKKAFSSNSGNVIMHGALFYVLNSTQANSYTLGAIKDQAHAYLGDATPLREKEDSVSPANTSSAPVFADSPNQHDVSSDRIDQIIDSSHNSDGSSGDSGSSGSSSSSSSSSSCGSSCGGAGCGG